MGLKDEIAETRSRVGAERLARHVAKSPARMRELMELFLTGDGETARRASWIVRKIADERLDAIGPYVARMVTRMRQPEMHPAVRRQVTAILQCIDIPPRVRGLALDACFTLLADASEPVAVRANAMTVVGRIAGHQPELAREARLVIEQQLPYASAAFTARARKILPVLARAEENPTIPSQTTPRS